MTTPTTDQLYRYARRWAEPTTDQLYRYARRWADGFRNRAIELDKAGGFPTVRQCAARFRCAQSVIEAVANEGDTTDDGYLGTAGYENDLPGDWVVEAYGRPGEPEGLTVDNEYDDGVAP